MGPVVLPERAVKDVIGVAVGLPLPEAVPRSPVLPDGEVVEIPVPAGVPVAAALPVAAVDPELVEPALALLEAHALVVLVLWLLPGDVDPPVPESAWASPDPLASAEPSPKVTAPAPSHVGVGL